ncbi:MAG: LptF/LptG family permease [Kiritimatiellae bacterium]|nr:LptF/LptG family permease [Kiritimatiellia bacterium]
MRLLTRYVLREFLVPLGYCLCGFVSVYVLFELFGSFARLMEAKLPLAVVVRYFLGYLSPFFMWLAPAALMLGTLYTMWNFCRHSEIVAMRASGISFIAIVKPLLCVAGLMAAFVAWVNECYVPAQAQWAKTLRDERFDLKKVERVDNIVYCSPKTGRTWTVDGVEDDEGRRLLDVKVTEDGPDGRRIRSVTAASAEYLDGEWWFSGATVRHYDAGGRERPSPTPALDALPVRVFPEFRDRPSDILLQNRQWSYNSVRGKLRFIRSHRDLTPEQRRKFTYNAWAQIMAPFACIVITLFAIPAGIASGRQSVFRGILGAIGMFFAFYGLTIGCMVAANSGWIPPIPAAILPDVVFLLLGVRAFMRQR